VRRTGLATYAEAEERVDAIGLLLKIADEHQHDPAHAAKVRTDILSRIQAALKNREPLPDYEELHKCARTGSPILNKPTVAAWLTEWLAAKGAIARNTHRSYESHLRLYLIPHIGEIPLDKLRVSHLHTMFAAISEEADLIPAQNNARRAVHDALDSARKRGDHAAARAASNALAQMPPFRRPAKATSRQRIRATLRSALSAACEQELITVNVAKLLSLPTGRRPKGQVWTAARVAAWSQDGIVPCPVMVWTTEQTTAFLTHASTHPFYILYHLVSRTGMRRGEACGLRWIDLDLDSATMTVAQQIVQLGWETATGAPKTNAGERTVALDQRTVKLLRQQRQTQDHHRQTAGKAWIETGLVFTHPDGTPLHPAQVTKQFQHLTEEADLPPIRLHDLRHGAATHALAAGVDMKVVSERLGHSGIAITSDTYSAVVTQLERAAANQLAQQFGDEPENGPHHTNTAPAAPDGQDHPHTPVHAHDRPTPPAPGPNRPARRSRRAQRRTLDHTRPVPFGD
jgi:integrase